MQPNYKILYSRVALDDIDEIFSYIAKDNISSAEVLLEKFDKSILKLGNFPNLGSVLSEDRFTLISSGYRFLVVHPYIVFYRIIKESVVIHRILHSRRDCLRGLFEISEK
jgi:toxin ParE1/3/4